MGNDLVMLSAIQHYTFCPRQCALIHIDHIWSDNALTAAGNILHEKADSGAPENRPGIRIERGVAVSSELYGLVGKLDVLEYHSDTGELVPVEYKKGKPKKDLSDKVQLCAQALCLEEMTGKEVRNGAFWYWGTRRRLEVAIDGKLRQTTINTAIAIRKLLDEGITPPAQYGAKCKSCSLLDLCSPNIASSRVDSYVQSLYGGNL
ncbi:MAG: CRISPR-associated protein Cas4 [Deferribacteraceae bacterium]|jgi:CRISPR-associated exonuclease Cas4|nr:CRISPR-associated protein Cas4 [Deferribacteraceae bacterium]